MKKKFKLIGVFILLICIFLSGCEELEKFSKPEYITVTVRCSVDVQTWDGSSENNWNDVNGILVKVEIIKDGGERVSEIVTTNNIGWTPEVCGTFNVYNKQSIVCIANIVDTFEKLPNYTFSGSEWTLTWDQLDATYDFGDSGEWSPQLIVKGYRNEI